MLRTDRLDAVTAEVTDLLARTPLPADALPPALTPVLRIAKMAGLDLEAIFRAQAIGSIASFASRASADPERADAVAGWIAHLLAWLRDERDDPPAADLPLL